MKDNKMFRIWDNIRKEWLMGYKTIGGFSMLGESILLGEYDLALSLFRLEEWNEIKLMQYTGLDDINSNNIFEGDILQSPDKEMLFRVYSVPGGFAINCPVPAWKNDIRKEHPFPLQPLADEQTASWVQQSCSVIGNIYDNPDLISEDPEMDRLKKIVEDVKEILGHSYAQLTFRPQDWKPEPVAENQWRRLAAYIQDFVPAINPIGEMKMLMVATKPYRDVQWVKECREKLVAKYEALKLEKYGETKSDW